MKLLNTGCGGQRPQSDIWWNTDTLKQQLAVGTPERTNLDKEPKYREWDMLLEDAPFHDDYFDGILLQHVIEHFTCHESVLVLQKCRRVLKPGGLLVVSVPDAEYFLSVYDEDTKERAIELFGEPIHDAGFERFFDYGLFRYDHVQVLSQPSLICLFLKAGFKSGARFIHYSRAKWSGPLYVGQPSEEPLSFRSAREIEKQMNRRRFSLEMCAVK